MALVSEQLIAFFFFNFLAGKMESTLGFLIFCMDFGMPRGELGFLEGIWIFHLGDDTWMGAG